MATPVLLKLAGQDVGISNNFHHSNKMDPFAQSIPASFLTDSRFWVYLIIVVIVAIGGYLIMGNINTSWYQQLNRPSFQPPPWVFSVMWILIYLSLAYVVYRVTTLAMTSSQRNLINGLFALNLILTLVWSFVFFRQHNLQAGLFIIILLLITVIGLMLVISSIDSRLPFWLILYLVWLGVAFALNWQYLRHNPT